MARRALVCWQSMRSWILMQQLGWKPQETQGATMDCQWCCQRFSPQSVSGLKGRSLLICSNYKATDLVTRLKASSYQPPIIKLVQPFAAVHIGSSSVELLVIQLTTSMWSCCVLAVGNLQMFACMFNTLPAVRLRLVCCAGWSLQLAPCCWLPWWAACCWPGGAVNVPRQMQRGLTSYSRPL
jgi:hypothetical protein